jgi:hypothetical protein
MSACVYCGGQCLDPHDDEGESCKWCFSIECVCPRCLCGVRLTKEEEPDDLCARCLSNSKLSF